MLGSEAPVSLSGKVGNLKRVLAFHLCAHGAAKVPLHCWCQGSGLKG